MRSLYRMDNIKINTAKKLSEAYGAKLTSTGELEVLV